MAEDSNIVLNSDDQSLGSIKVAPRVIETIAGIAANEVDGVAKMHGTKSVGSLFSGHEDRRQGIHLSEEDDTLEVEVGVYVDYGVSVPKVAAEIQDKIKSQVALMTNLTVDSVNVHIQGIVAPKEDKPVDPDAMFDQPSDEDGDEQ